MALNIIMCFVLLFVAAFFIRSCRRPSLDKRLPGPSRLPIVGNLLPSGRIWIKLAEWGRDYAGTSGIYSISIFGTPALVVNSANAARDLFDLRSGRYANRPVPKIIEMTGFDRGVVLEHDPTRLRLGRKIMRAVIQPRQLENYTDDMNTHLMAFLKKLVHDPSDFEAHARHLTSAIMFLMSHGYDVQEHDDPFLREANILVENFAQAANFGGFLVDWIPFLSTFPLPDFFPGMGFKRQARIWRAHYDKVADEGYQYVKDQLARGTARPSMSSKALSDTTQYPEDVIKFSATQTYTGGADTTASTISAFILMMVRHPEVQAAAQAEIDQIVGSDRLPAYTDRPDLAHVDAIFAEVLRMLPPIPAVSREASEDDIYKGYLIPRGTFIFENIWGMLHDPSVYPDPFAFKPERWLNVTKDEFPDHPYNVVFGFGRRACPGQILADQLAFVALANVLALFDITPCRDDAGEAIIPPCEQTDGSIIFPLPFKCSIRPRSERTSQLLQKNLTIII